MGKTYKIVRMYHGKPDHIHGHLNLRHRTIRTGLTLEQAQTHCNDPETSSPTCTTVRAKAVTRRNEEWFDTWTEE